MTNLKPARAGGSVLATMIDLARCSTQQRIVLAGTAATQRMVELHRRGYRRVATTATCGLPRGQYDVALVEWQLHSITALEATLDWLVHFLCPAGVLVIWIDAEESSGQRKLTSMLEKLGFHVEVGTRCDSGIAISALRRDARLAIAA
jgi:hypothetical protein